MHTLHRVSSAEDILAAAHRNGRVVRYWLDTANQITGMWQARNGTALAVGDCYARNMKPCVYRTMTPEDNFTRGGSPATHKDMASYRHLMLHFGC